MTPIVRLTPRAVADMRDIGRYTLKKWGKPQRDQYLRTIDQRFHWLAQQPQRGRSRADISHGYYSFPQGEHVIFYIIHVHGIDIIGVPHQAMDIPSHLKGYPEA